MGVVNSRSSVPPARSRRIVMAAMGNITAHGMTAIWKMPSRSYGVRPSGPGPCSDSVE